MDFGTNAFAVIPEVNAKFSEAVLQRCSAVNLLDIFRTPFYKNTSGGLLLRFHESFSEVFRGFRKKRYVDIRKPGNNFMTTNYDFMRLMPNLKPFRKFMELSHRVIHIHVILNQREVEKRAPKS